MKITQDKKIREFMTWLGDRQSVEQQKRYAYIMWADSEPDLNLEVLYMVIDEYQTKWKYDINENINSLDIRKAYIAKTKSARVEVKNEEIKQITCNYCYQKFKMEWIGANAFLPKAFRVHNPLCVFTFMRLTEDERQVILAGYQDKDKAGAAKTAITKLNSEREILKRAISKRIGIIKGEGIQFKLVYECGTELTIDEAIERERTNPIAKPIDIDWLEQEVM